MWSRKVFIETNKTIGCDTYTAPGYKPDLLDLATCFKVQGDDCGHVGACFYIDLNESNTYNETPLCLTSIYDLTMINWDIREVCGIEKYS